MFVPLLTGGHDKAPDLVVQPPQWFHKVFDVHHHSSVPFINGTDCL
jgi:hypothetical protein